MQNTIGLQGRSCIFVYTVKAKFMNAGQNDERNVQILLNKEIQPTAMRLLTLEYLLEQQAAVSLADIEMHFHKADRTTLYRTLKTFEQKGVIHSIQEQQVTKYLLCDESCATGIHHDDHLHFFCTKCRNTTCLHQVDLSVMSLPPGFSVVQWHFSASGICDRCAGTMQ
jgi:Fur family ferric uptake transcriptional regulator